MQKLILRGAGAVLILCIGVVWSGCELVPGGATLELRNQLTTSIVQFNMVPSSSTTWGSNQLSSSVPPGGSRAFSVVPGTYDLRAVDSLGRSVSRFGVRIQPGETKYWTISEAKDGEAVEDEVEALAAAAL